jgi:DNA-binding FrmR family transcriptional regulator
MDQGLKRDAALRLKVAAGHLESVRRMVDGDVYCIDIMKQVAAVQSRLEKVQRIVLRSHLLTCGPMRRKEDLAHRSSMNRSMR